MATPATQIESRISGSQNKAPVKPLLELKRGGKKPDSRIQKAIQERFTHFHRKDKDIFREIVNVGQLISLFVNGKQFPVMNPYDGSWGVLPVRANSDSSRRALNVMRDIVQGLLGKWENSSPDVMVRPGRNLDKCALAAKSADAIIDYYERQFYNPWFSQQEALMAMTFGTYIDRYRFDENKPSMSVIQDIFQPTNVTFGQGAGYCADCGSSGNYDQFAHSSPDLGALGGSGSLAQPKCPNCGSTSVLLDKPAQGNVMSMAGQEQKQVGDLVCELLPMPSCRWDLARRPEDSSYLIYRQNIPKGAITRILGNVLVPKGEEDQDHGLEILRALQKEGQALSGYSNYGNRRRQLDLEARDDGNTFDEMWLSPDDYADINLLGDEDTVDGSAVPKGKLIDLFPDGLCAVGLNGMAVVLALYPEKHCDHIVSGTWFTQAQTGSGRGLADTVEIQKQFNSLNNQALAYMSSTYTPAVGYDNQIWAGSKVKYLGTPRTNIPFDLTKLPEGRSLKDSVFQFAPQSIPSQFFQYAQNFLSVMFQKTSGRSDYDQQTPGITATNTTATAAEIDQGNADQINQPIFLIKADARKRGAQITLNLFRKHFPMKRYFDLGGTYGKVQGMELSSADVDADLVFEVAKNSEMPKGPFTRMKNLNSVAQNFNGFPGLLQSLQMAPKETSMILQTYDVDLDFEDFDEVGDLCRKRLNQMKQAARVGVDDPQVLIQAIQPPIDQAEPKLQEKAKWFSEALDWDELQDSPMPLRQAVSMLAQGQFQAATQQEATKAFSAGMVQAATAAPGAIGQSMLEQQGQQEPAPQVDPNQLISAHNDAADRDHQMQQADMDAQQQQAGMQQDAMQQAHERAMQQNEMQMQAREHANKQKIEALKAKQKVARAKPKPAAKKSKAKK
jgi:hypothetical protein